MSYYIDSAPNIRHTEHYTPMGRHLYLYHVPCATCGEEHVITIDGDQLFKFRTSGRAIQDCLVSNCEHEREMIITGLCPSCWDKLFNEGED